MNQWLITQTSIFMNMLYTLLNMMAMIALMIKYLNQHIYDYLMIINIYYMYIET